MRLWFDTEFMEDGRAIEMLSIGIVREDGATLYLESGEADRSHANLWVQANVLPNLTGPMASRSEIRTQVVEFAGGQPEFWAYFAAYDWVVLCQLFGSMGDLPQSWPMHCCDLQQSAYERGIDLECEVPPPETVHNALSDAHWNRRAWEYIYERSASSN